MEMILMILPAAFFAGIIGLAACFGGGENSRANVDDRMDESGPVELFDDVTDPAQSYLIYNVHHENSIGDDNSDDWDDSTSSSLWDD